MCVGLIGRVVRTLDADRQLVEVDIGGVLRPVNGAMVGLKQLPPGTYVLVSVGMAVEILSQEDALEQIRLLKELEESFEDLVAEPATERA